MFGDFTALENISLDVFEGEFVCFLGPSGCGKTTLLRAIAGLDIQTYGRIEQAGRDISGLPPSERDFGIVFQSYALFPNLTVNRNVAYGLENRKTPKPEIEAKVAELLQLVGLPEQGGKYPAQLSGGQQQRVALARALATSPGLLLLDEPLSALDAKVRARLRHEIKDLQLKLGVTTIMVTHDQEEALTMADRIVVMNEGVIEQVGTPEDIYSRPESPFVADFVGTMNFLAGTAGAGGSVKLDGIELTTNGANEANDTDAAIDAPITICIRPEDVVTREVNKDTDNAVPAVVDTLEFLGSFYRISLHTQGPARTGFRADFSINLMRDLDISEGREVVVSFPADLIRVYGEAFTHSDETA
ncbi:MAG: putative 2-aminoethylphosphonate ABC transporter ATP-binding protein [Rhodospirillaceae bacterium]|nr:putative 2-aminoethylphosphonate ABC transporter ATP-binding protein [Rhodospirillaceae bacterium]MBT7942612.1 putative 2-aminoethylphosphonate ABC transporter ATP-binding protein [Alphaproteobacteria bacterium]